MARKSLHRPLMSVLVASLCVGAGWMCAKDGAVTGRPFPPPVTVGGGTDSGPDSGPDAGNDPPLDQLACPSETQVSRTSGVGGAAALLPLCNGLVVVGGADLEIVNANSGQLVKAFPLPAPATAVRGLALDEANARVVAATNAPFLFAVNLHNQSTYSIPAPNSAVSLTWLGGTRIGYLNPAQFGLVADDTSTANTATVESTTGLHSLAYNPVGHRVFALFETTLQTFSFDPAAAAPFAYLSSSSLLGSTCASALATSDGVHATALCDSQILYDFSGANGTARQPDWSLSIAPTAMAFSADGTRLLAGSTSGLQVLSTDASRSVVKSFHPDVTAQGTCQSPFVTQAGFSRGRSTAFALISCAGSSSVKGVLVAEPSP